METFAAPGPGTVAAAPPSRGTRGIATMPATMVLLEGVSRRYELGGIEVVALDGVDLDVDEGEFIVVLGPSGSGKTTLLNLIGALDSPTEGTVTVAGRRHHARDALGALRLPAPRRSASSSRPSTCSPG